jgi:hypothetical protein
VEVGIENDFAADGEAGRVAITAINATFAISDAASSRVVGFTVDGESGILGGTTTVQKSAETKMMIGL